MPIHRLPKTGKYLAVENALFEDKELSWEARGVQGYLLSKPDNWQVPVYDLVRHGPAGEHKISRILRELQAAGYISRRRITRPDGTFEWETEVYETPGINPFVGEVPKGE